jgi:DNA gyrase subunit B
MAGYATEISVTLLDDGMVRVSDNGRGIPVGIHKVTGVSALETVMTKLHAGGKFGEEGGGYKVSGGLHGVGVSVVNALSTYTKAEIHSNDGKIYVQEYNIGKPLKKTHVVGTTKWNGTIITFKPDPTIFTETEFKWGKILDHLRQQVYLNRGITMIIADERKDHRPKKYKFYFEGGIVSYIKTLNRNKTVKNETVFYIEKEIENNVVEVALQYNDEYTEVVLPFANNIYNPEGGTHLAGFRTALTRTINSYARNQKLLKEKEENLTGDDVREGLTAIISVKLRDPQFEGQTKGKLGNAEIKAMSSKYSAKPLPSSWKSTRKKPNRLSANASYPAKLVSPPVPPALQSLEKEPWRVLRFLVNLPIVPVANRKNAKSTSLREIRPAVQPNRVEIENSRLSCRCAVKS